MKLQNGYKIIYEKIVEGERHLFAGKGNVPSTEDVEIKYDSLTEEQVKAFKLIYEAGEGFKGSTKCIPTEDDAVFALTDGTSTVLAGDGYVAAVPTKTRSTRSSKKAVVVEEPVVEE